MSAIELRPHQAHDLGDIRGHYAAGTKRVLYCAPPGAGKSTALSYMLGRTALSTLYLVHRQELLDQVTAELDIPHGIIVAGRPTPKDRICVGMVQTVARRLADLPDFGWIISDECHLAAQDKWAAVLAHYRDAFHLGMSGSPKRLDGRPLRPLFDAMVLGPTPRELISLGYMVKPRVFAARREMPKMHKRAGDFAIEEAAAFMDRREITGDAVAEVWKHAPNRRFLVFCCTREHGRNTAAQFAEAGFRMEYVDGETPNRREIVRDFKAGKFQGLVNVNLLTTGYDDPTLDCLVGLRPSASEALVVQITGRLMRAAAAKVDAIYLDLAGNVFIHDMPDADRDWSLDDGRPARAAAPAVHQCAACFACWTGAGACPECHVAPTAKPRRRVLVQRAGELVELSEGDVKPSRILPYGKALIAAHTADQLRLVAAVFPQRVTMPLNDWIEHKLMLKRAYRGGGWARYGRAA